LREIAEVFVPDVGRRGKVTPLRPGASPFAADSR